MTSSPGGASSAEPQRTTVHLLRHGEVHNPQQLLYGRLPGYHLSELGRQMAELAAEHLADHDIVHVVSSPLERAQETAAPVAAEHGLEVTLDERVSRPRTPSRGCRSPGARVCCATPGSGRSWSTRCGPSWGEPYTELVARMRDAVVDARAAARGHEAVVVSHQAPIWMIRLATEGRSLVHNPAHRQCSLASLTSLTFVGDELLSLAYCEPAADPPAPGAEGGRSVSTRHPWRAVAGAAALVALALTGCTPGPQLRCRAGQGRRPEGVRLRGRHGRDDPRRRAGRAGDDERLARRRHALGHRVDARQRRSSSTSGGRGAPRASPRPRTCRRRGRSSRPRTRPSTSSASTSARRPCAARPS